MPSAHADPTHELPPPSAQRASWTAPAPVRARGKAGSRTVPARHGPWSRSSGSKHGEPTTTTGQESPHATSLAATAGLTVPSTRSRGEANNGHIVSQSDEVSIPSKVTSSSFIPNCQTNPFGPQSSTPSPTHNPSRSSSGAAPASRTFFDPWNSSSTGHQRAENRVSSSTSWRDSRNLKLGQQYKGGLAGGAKRVADTVGAGSEGFGKDGRKANGGWERGAPGLRAGGQKSLIEIWGASKASNTPRRDSSSKFESENEGTTKPASGPPLEPTRFDEDETNLARFEISDMYRDACPNPPSQAKQIFNGLCVYLNGSTAPLVSDHKLKHMLAEHGANMSITLGRRSVTHVILSATSANGGCGGGLAATKLQKEITKIRGRSVKFVTAHWVLESIKEGRLLPEARFPALKLAHQRQGSVYGMFRAND